MGENVPIRIPPHQPVDGPSHAGKVDVDTGDRKNALRRHDEREGRPEWHYNRVGSRREDCPPIVVVTERIGSRNRAVAEHERLALAGPNDPPVGLGESAPYVGHLGQHSGPSPRQFRRQTGSHPRHQTVQFLLGREVVLGPEAHDGGLILRRPFIHQAGVAAQRDPIALTRQRNLIFTDQDPSPLVDSLVAQCGPAGPDLAVRRHNRVEAGRQDLDALCEGPGRARPLAPGPPGSP